MCWSAHVLFIATVAPHFSEECAERLFKRVDDALAAGQRIVYGGKAVSLGVGVKVDRSQEPKTTGNADSVAVSSVDSEKEEGMAAALYEKAVVDAIKQVMGPSHQGFLAKAKAVSIELWEAGGVDKATQIVLKVASGKD